MFGFGNKKKFRRRVRALLPTVGIDEGDAGILHIYSLIDDWYLKGLNEYETALAFNRSFIFSLERFERLLTFEQIERFERFEQT